MSREKGLLDKLFIVSLMYYLLFPIPAFITVLISFKFFFALFSLTYLANAILSCTIYHLYIKQKEDDEQE
jgi:hypothetical protein